MVDSGRKANKPTNLGNYFIEESLGVIPNIRVIIFIDSKRSTRVLY